MQSNAQVSASSLYDTDYQLWLDQTIAQLRAKEFSQIDLENLIEEIESLGRSDKRAIFSYLIRLCEHLLKVKYWESERETCFQGWVQEISNFRLEIDLLLDDSPSLNPLLEEKLASAYQKARKNLLQVVPLLTDFISEKPCFTLEQALDENWLPWHPE